MSKHTVSASICLLGIDVPVEVEIDLTSSGSAASWDDPGDPPEFDIISVVKKSNEEDITKFCEKSFDYYSNKAETRPWFYPVPSLALSWQDPIRSAMFGQPDYRQVLDTKYQHIAIETHLYKMLPTLVDSLHDYIMEHHINDILYDKSQAYIED